MKTTITGTMGEASIHTISLLIFPAILPDLLILNNSINANKATRYKLYFDDKGNKVIAANITANSQSDLLGVLLICLIFINLSLIKLKIHQQIYYLSPT